MHSTHISVSEIDNDLAFVAEKLSKYVQRSAESLTQGITGRWGAHHIYDSMSVTVMVKTKFATVTVVVEPSIIGSD